MKGNMKRNIYQKLHDACLSAKSVKKGAKANGMHFNPLLHDDVQAVATQALLDNGLYATCNYLTEIVPNIKQVMVVCTMKVYDVDDPTQHILVDGCSAFGNCDKFGTGNAMSYSRKYAFLNLLNLKTGIKDEDGYDPAPFEKQNSPEQSVEEPTYLDDEVDVEGIITKISATNSTKSLGAVKDEVRDQVMYLKKNNLKAYEEVAKLTREHEVKLNNNQQ